MYYNYLKKMWVLDPIDLVLLSFLISRFIGSWVRDYLSEKAAKERLKRDVIEHSRLLEQAGEITSTNVLTSQYKLGKSNSKVSKVYKVAIQTRGGTDTDNVSLLNDLPSIWADFFQRVTIKFVALLRTREAKYNDRKQWQDLVLRIILSQSRFGIELLLRYCNINLTYLWIPEWNQYFVTSAVITSSLTGFTMGWLKFGFIVFVR